MGPSRYIDISLLCQFVETIFFHSTLATVCKHLDESVFKTVEFDKWTNNEFVRFRCSSLNILIVDGTRYALTVRPKELYHNVCKKYVLIIIICFCIASKATLMAHTTFRRHRTWSMVKHARFFVETEYKFIQNLD